jgi:hypothetical protein
MYAGHVGMLADTPPAIYTNFMELPVTLPSLANHLLACATSILLLALFS